MDSTCSKTEEVLMKLKGVVKVQRLGEAEKESAEKLECQAESKVLMGLCPGTNIGLRDALSKRNVFACLTDDTFVWPSCSYIRLVCGDELIGQDIYNDEELRRRREEGDLVAGNLVFYRSKMGILREKKTELRVHMMPMEIEELSACGAVVASPSPPTDTFLKKVLGANLEDRRLGTIVVGVD